MVQQTFEGKSFHEFDWKRILRWEWNQLAYEFMQCIKMINSNAAVREYFSFAWTPYIKLLWIYSRFSRSILRFFFLSMNFGVVVPSQVSMRTRKFNSTFHLCGNFMRFSIHKCSLYFLHPWGMLNESFREDIKFI